jgi:hypothetical protein
MPTDHTTSTPCVSPEIERWLPVVGWSGYEVSDWSRVRSYWEKRGLGRPLGVMHVIGTTPRLLKISKNTAGRWFVTLQGKPKKRRPRLCYALMLEAFVGPCPPGMVACHNDGDISNNRLGNLRWDTPRNNNLDTVRQGKHHKAKLTEADISAIWERIQAGECQAAIARAYDVHPNTIWSITSGDNWSHITGIFKPARKRIRRSRAKERVDT